MDRPTVWLSHGYPPSWPAGADRPAPTPEIRVHLPTLEKILAWARTAPAAEDESHLHLKILTELDDDRLSKVRGVRAIEAELAGLLVQTPYVLLMGIPGINVVSAAEFAGEMGPIERYATARAITGRAACFPLATRVITSTTRMANWFASQPQPQAGDHDDRGQPGQVQRPFQGSGHGVAIHGRDAREVRVQVAGRFSRIAYQMVAGRKAYRHPCCQQRDYILNKLLIFHTDNEIGYDQLMINLDAAVAQLPRSEYGRKRIRWRTSSTGS